MSSTRRARPGAGSSTRWRVRSMLNGCAASQSAAPGYGVVSTCVSSGGRRRQSSYRYDWMPPILGGKSFVTRSDVTERRALRGDVLGGRVRRSTPAGREADPELKQHDA